GVHIDGLRSGDQVSGERWGGSYSAAGEVVSDCQDWQRIAVAGGNVRRVVNYWCWIDRHKETGLRRTVGNGPGPGENIDGLRSGDAVAREQWGARSTAAGEIVPVCQDWQRVAVAGGNVRRGVNYWCWVEIGRAACRRRVMGKGRGVCEDIEGRRRGDQ